MGLFLQFSLLVESFRCGCAHVLCLFVARMYFVYLFRHYSRAGFFRGFGRSFFNIIMCFY